jgi:hypothetical protein
MLFTWIFTRGTERLEIRRSGDPAAKQLVIWTSDGQPQRTFDFEDHAALVTFHAQLEQDLTHKQWSFAGFDPERRAGTDRRRVARPTERRTLARRRPQTSGV